MTPYHRDPDCTYYVGDVREVAAALAEKSVHVAVCSPPYWGLRDYGIAPSVWGGDAECVHEWGDETKQRAGRNDQDRDTRHTDGRNPKTQGLVGCPKQEVSTGSTCALCSAWRGCLGLEPIPDCLGWARGVNCGACFICHMREVAAHVWRVLRDDGTFWCNIGDSYSGSNQTGGTGSLEKGTRIARMFKAPKSDFLPAKNRVGIPERLALALQSDGWTWRDTIHLCKVAPMPESVRDRTTQAHEPLFVFSKRARYYWDQEAVRERFTDDRMGNPGPSSLRYSLGAGRRDSFGDGWNTDGAVTGRNPRSWMLWSPEPSAVQHYATFPRFIPSFAIRAGSSEYGVCSECLAPWERVTERISVRDQLSDIGQRWDMSPKNRELEWDGTRNSALSVSHGQPNSPIVTTLGFRPTCQHNAEVIPATIWDPFSGSGTTQRVARELGRHSIYTDLSTAYADMAIGLMEKVTPMLGGFNGQVKNEPSQLTLEAV